MRDLEQEIIRKIEERAKLQKLEEQAREEITNMPAPAVSPGTVERRLLLTAAVFIIIFMPFLYLAEGILLSLFTIVITVVAGLTAARRTPIFNLFLSVLGALMFQFAAIYAYQVHHYESFLFWMDELLAIIFIFATYFSVKTYRLHYALDEKRQLQAIRHEKERELSGPPAASDTETL